MSAASVGEHAPPDPSSPEERATWRRELEWPQSCEDAFVDAGGIGAGLRFYDLGPGHFLARVTCAPGAYQGSATYVDVNRSRTPAAHVLELEAPVSPDGDRLVLERTSEVWGSARFDPSRKTLTVLNVFRGIGDCGVQSEYAVGAEVPVLLTIHAKPACDGTGSGQSDAWPIVPKESLR